MSERLIEVLNMSTTMRSTLRDALASEQHELTYSPLMKSTGLKCVGLGVDEVLVLRFTSIRAAVQSTAIFSKTLSYSSCTVKYAPESCAQLLDSLLEARGRTDTFEAIEEEHDLEPSESSGDGRTICDEKSGRLTEAVWKVLRGRLCTSRQCV